MNGSREHSPEPLDLRQAEAGDIEEIARLDGGSLDPAWSRSTYERELERHDALVLVAFIDRRLAGFIAVRLSTSPAEILRLAVAPRRRRQGLGRRLVHTAILHLAARGIDRCWLELREDNVEARALYASLGFRASGRRAGYYPDGAAAVLMARDGL
jgi:ribosomal-protein-alanine N-acetyltransferase